MRKAIMMMLVLIGAIAIIAPSTVLADWDQNELHMNQVDHDAMMGTADFTYGDESPVGYDLNGTGEGSFDDISLLNMAPEGAPGNTIPCPINVGDLVGPDYTFDGAMGNCPANINSSDPQTAPADVEFEAEVILDDLFQDMTETAVVYDGASTVGGTKMIAQSLDILFYVADTADGWTEAGIGGKLWNGGLGIDSTIYQSMSDIASTAPGVTTSWGVDHVAQTLYQDFQLWKDSASVAAGSTGEDIEDNAGIIDQWILQTIVDTFDQDYAGMPITGSGTFAQGYSSWMVVGNPVYICDEASDEHSNNLCTYDYEEKGHEVDKTIPENISNHELAPAELE